MRKYALVTLLFIIAVTATAQNLQKGSYGYLYCHMSDRGEWTAYAVSRDGYHYEDIKGGEPVFDPQEHARIEGGTRDAFITRTFDGQGYLMVTTDMCVAKSHVWDNYGIHGLYPQFGPICWEYAKHFSRDQETGEIIYDPYVK